MERRKYARNTELKPVYFELPRRDSYIAFSVDHAECGLGMITNQEIEPGDKVMVSSPGIWEGIKEARAIWVETLAYVSSSRRVGLDLCA